MLIKTLKEWLSHDEVNKALQEWIINYNENYLHSTHGHRTPNWIEKKLPEAKNCIKTLPKKSLTNRVHYSYWAHFELLIG